VWPTLAPDTLAVMRNRSSSLIVAGSAFALLLLILAVWLTGISAPAKLAVTALLILGAVAGVAASTNRGPGASLPVDADSEQRERMRGRVP
jgi:hypothetical protein